jgi:HAD superfamily hydrolase (TIGR01490 family)
MKVAAFFDMDRTLLRCNTGSEWVRFLRRRKEISTIAALRAATWIFRYKLSILDMEAVTTRLTATMAGQSEAELVEKCQLFVEEVVYPAIAPSAFEAVETHRRDGHVLAILSTSTPYITEPLAQKLGIDHVLCTRLDIVDGKFAGTHKKPACYGAGKVHWAERFAGEQGVDLATSFFYTDSYSDLPMLERVGEKRVINPDGRLARHARRVGWPVQEW